MWRILVVLAGCLPAAHANAETVEIGSASVEMPAGIWKRVAASEGETPLDGGFTGRLATDDRAFALMDGERVLAILLVSSSKTGSSIPTKWTNACAGTKNRYAYSIPSSGVHGLACASATGRLNTLTYLKLAVPKMFKALEALQPVLPPICYSASAVVGNSHGTMAYVNLVASPAFAGSSAQPLAAAPASVNPRHAAWADRLAVAIQESVDSIGGKLVIPSVEFVPSPTAAQPENASK